MMTKGQITRNMIIERSAPVFNKKGIAGTSISEFMEVTGLAKGGIYRNFESKDEISTEAFNFLCNQLSEGISGVVKVKVTAKDKLFALLDFYRDVLVINDGGCPLLNFGAEADDTNLVIRKLAGEKIKALQARISGLVDSGISAGEFNSGTNSSHFAV
ncbi:transcriptional regulator, TetR family [Mucilaginibacter polytrichastri]|nr:transcriptional regulator, TetR family [Mucilaginibacter polytrichastri]